MIPSVVGTVILCSCLSGRAAEPTPTARPLVASVQPVGVPPLPPAEVAEEEAISAGALLKRAFDFFKDDRNAEAAATFRAAIDTGNLNDAGRVLAYWHIYVAEQSLGHVDRGADALTSFVVVAQDVIAIRKQLRYAEDDSGDFVDRFDLKHRLARARAILSAEWADETRAFGRSATLPVPVHDDAEKAFFLDMAAPCQKSQDRHLAAEDGAVQRVEVQCDGLGRGSYYFETHSSAEAAD